MNDLARTEQHAALRHRRITGSRAKTIMTGGPQAWDKLSDTLRAEEPEKFYDLANTPNMPEQMKRGLEYEDQARGEFFFQHDEYEIEQPTFCVPAATQEELGIEGLETYGTCGDTLLDQWIGVSPDAMLIYGEALKVAGLELKVPSMEKHLEWREAGTLPAEYLPQVAISILATSADHWWFCSFCPELEGEERYFEIKVPHETIEKYLDLMVSKLHEFLDGHLNNRVFGPTLNTEEQPLKSEATFPIVDYGIEEAAIAVLTERYNTLEAPTNSTEFAVVKAANLDLVKRRTGIEKAKKKATETARQYINGVNGEAKRLTGMLALTEVHTKTLRTDWETEAQRKKDEKEAAEAARVEYLQMCVDALGLMSEDLHTMTSDQIREQIDIFGYIEISVDYEDFQEQAQNALEALLFRADKILAEVVAKEEAAAEAARVQAEKDAELERLQQEAVKREEREAAEKAEREQEANERAEQEAAEQAKREDTERIRGNIGEIIAAPMDAMTGDLDQAQAVLQRLNQIDITDVDEYGDDLATITLFNKAKEVVETIVATKIRDAVTAAKTAKAERQAALRIDWCAIAESFPVVDAEFVEEEPLERESEQGYESMLCIHPGGNEIPELYLSTDGQYKGHLFGLDKGWIDLANMYDYFNGMKRTVLKGAIGEG